jgi:SAM-dependent methyltransferase
MRRSAFCDSGVMTEEPWRWDPSLYAGSASYYARGRVPYPAELIDCLVGELALDGRGRLLDVGCGPGSLTIPLALHFEQVVGVDADQQMLAIGAQRAAAAGASNIEWVHRRAEDLTVDAGPFRVVTLAQAFHWMDRERVARLLREMLARDGVLVHVHAMTHQGIESTDALPYPRPPHRQIDALVKKFLGDPRRAGQGYWTVGTKDEVELGVEESAIYRAAGFTHARRLNVPGSVVVRSDDQVVASVFSLSYAAPHLFGDHAPEFEDELRALLRRASPAGHFSEAMREINVDVWRA